MNKTKGLIILLIASILINGHLLYSLIEVKNTQKKMKVCMFYRADRAIDNVTNNIGKLEDEWDEISDSKKMIYLGDAESELNIAIEFMSASDNFFLPVKIYKDGIYSMEQKILEGVDAEIQKNYIIGLHDDFTLLWKFLATNDISNMTHEQAREKWKSVVEDLKTEDIYISYN